MKNCDYWSRTCWFNNSCFHLAETGYRPTVFEKSEHPGGMLRYGIPSYKLEKDLLDAEIDVAKAMGVEIKTGIEVGKDVTIQQLREQGYKAFYIAIDALLVVYQT